jgi:hypothetical protein
MAEKHYTWSTLRQNWDENEVPAGKESDYEKVNILFIEPDGTRVLIEKNISKTIRRFLQEEPLSNKEKSTYTNIKDKRTASSGFADLTAINTVYALSDQKNGLFKRNPSEAAVKSSKKGAKTQPRIPDLPVEDQAMLIFYLQEIIEEARKQNLNSEFKNLIKINTNDGELNRYFVNLLFNPKNINKFLSASPLLLSSIIPKIRIYKVIQSKIGGEANKSLLGTPKDRERTTYTFSVPFEDFLSASLISEDTSFLAKEYGKATGAGLKSVSISDSSSLETPTNINVGLKLLFSNFDIIYKKFVVTSEEDEGVYTVIRFADLFNKDSAKVDSSTGTAAETVDDYSFRVKLTIGWSYDPKLLRRINYGSDSISESDIIDIKNALDGCTTTYYLGYKSLNINIEEQGKVNIDVEYASSIQGIFGSRDANVIYELDPKTGKAITLQNIIKNINTAIDERASVTEPLGSFGSEKSKKKSKEEIAEQKRDENLRKKITKKIAEDRNALYKNFLTHLFNNLEVKYIEVPNAVLNTIKETIINKDPDVINKTFQLQQKRANRIDIKSYAPNEKNLKTDEFLTGVDLEDKESLGKKLDEFEKAVKEQRVIDKTGNKRFNFIFLGSILDYIFGALNTDLSVEFKHCLPIVGNFNISDIKEIKVKNSENGGLPAKQVIYETAKSYNYCDLPISLERFKKFIFEEFINKQVTNVKIEDFIRNLFQKIVFPSLDANLFGEQIKYIFGNLATGQATLRTYNDGAGEKEYFTRLPYEDVLNRRRKFQAIDLENFRKSPPNFDQEKYKKSYIFNYFYMFSKPYNNVSGKYLDFDTRESNGIVNVQLGAEKGLVKKINFSKNNKVDLAPSAWLENRSLSKSNPFIFQGLMNADIEMFGNTFFKAGAMLYIDPSFMYISPNMSSKEIKELGLGGYYYVTKINHELEPGKFVTKLTTLFNHFGNDQQTFIQETPASAEAAKQARGNRVALEQKYPDQTIEKNPKTQNSKKASSIKKPPKR